MYRRELLAMDNAIKLFSEANKFHFIVHRDVSSEIFEWKNTPKKIVCASLERFD